MRERRIAILLFAAGCSFAHFGAQAGDDCGRNDRVPLPHCTTWDYETIHNVTTGSYDELQVDNDCSERIVVKVDVGAGKSDSLGEIPPYTSWRMRRHFETEEEKKLVRSVTCCVKLSRCYYD